MSPADGAFSSSLGAGSTGFPGGHHEYECRAGALKHLLSLLGGHRGCCLLSMSGWALEINLEPIVVVVVSEGLG